MARNGASVPSTGRRRTRLHFDPVVDEATFWPIVRLEVAASVSTRPRQEADLPSVCPAGQGQLAAILGETRYQPGAAACVCLLAGAAG